MSLATLRSRSLSGMDAPEVTVEVHLANGLPSFTLVGPQLHPSECHALCDNAYRAP